MTPGSGDGTVDTWLNGDPADVAGCTVEHLVAEHAASPKGIAVAVNGEVVPRSAWSSLMVRAGDRVEILSAAQGG